MPVMDIACVAISLASFALFIVYHFKVARLSARERRLGSRVDELSRSIAEVHLWTAQQLRGLRGEAAVVRVNESAAEALARQARTPAPVTPLLELADDDGEPTNVLDPDPDPPMYARLSSMLPPPPLAHPDFIGCEDIADEAARPRLGPDEKTPPRRGRAPMLLAAYSTTDEEGAA
jgi:hypothetical protein